MPLQLYSPEVSKRLNASFLVEQRHIFRTLDREIQRGPAVGIYGLEDWLTPIASIALHIDPLEGLILKPDQVSSKALSELIDTSKIFILCSENGKYQFTGKKLKINEDGNITCEMPTEIYHIQRRESFRVIPPVDESFKLIIGLGAGQELLGNVVDVGRNGLQADIRAGATEVTVGGYWHTCYFERLSSRTAYFDVMIKHQYQGNDIGRVRVGCELYKPKPQTIREFENLVDTIQKARAMSNQKKWYLDLSWWKGQIF